MDTEHLTAVCTALGSLREDANGRDVYVKHDDCLVNLKHLQRFLRRDDPVEREIFMQLGKWNTIRQDILPIVIHYRDDYDLVLNAGEQVSIDRSVDLDCSWINRGIIKKVPLGAHSLIPSPGAGETDEAGSGETDEAGSDVYRTVCFSTVKVMVFLTMPVDPSSADIPHQLEYLRQFKEAVLEDDAMGVIVSHLQDPLEHMESGTLTDMDGKMFQLVLTLIRNLLAVDDPSSPLVRASLVDSQQASYVKDALIERLFNENVMDLLLALTQHVGGEHPFLRQDIFLILEIIFYLFSGQTAEAIASARGNAHKEPKSQPSGAVLEAVMKKEREENRQRFGGPRHSNFCGMFVRVGKDGSKTIITKNPYGSPLDNLFQKPEIKRGLVKKVATDLPVHVRSNPTVCSLLKGFADQLLEGNYNLLMQTVKSDIRGERNDVQKQDVVMFFAVANFFTTYQRCLLMKKPKDSVQQSGETNNQTEDSGSVFQGRCGRIASTMDEDMFILVTMKWQSFVEAAKESNEWFPATSSGALLKEMIHMLDYILKASDPNTTEGQQEIRVARILLYKVFYDHTDNGILPFIFKLMKTFDIHKQPRSQLAGLVETTHIVLRLLDSITKQDGALRVKKKVRVAKKKTSKPPQPKSSHVPESIGDATDKEVAEAAVSSETQVEPEDASVNVPVLNDEHTEQANSNPGPVGDVEVPSEERDRDNMEEPDNNDAGDREECEEGESDYDSEEEEEEMQTKEETLDVFKCVRMFADNTIVHNYCWLLKNYLHNTPAINYYIVRMLQRICEDLGLEPMLYQLSILQTCYEILSNRTIRNSDQHQFVISFLTKLVQHLFEKLKTSPMLFVDLLFWKSKQDCHCITANYEIEDLRKFSKGVGKHVNNDLPGQDRRTLLESLGDDDDDDMGNPAHVQDRRALLNSLGDDDDDDNAKMPSVKTLFKSSDSNKEKGRVNRQKAVKKKGPFTDFQEDLIKDLFERFKENRSCSRLIAEGLQEAGAVQESGEPFTPAQVSRGLKRLGLSRVIGKKTTQNELLRNIRSQSDDENGSGSDNERDGQQTDAAENVDSGKRSDEEMSDDEGGNRQDGQAAAGGGEERSSQEKKRKSGAADVQGGNLASKRSRRTGLFSEEQDHKLQSLFEKYKGMTRFKHLIVNDLDGVFTTAQIGRRLQKLGCVEPRKRKSKLAKMSDDENEGSQRSSQEHASDDIQGHSSDHAKEPVELPIGSLLKASWGPSARRKPAAAEVLQADSSDDDVPIALHHSMRSVFQKKKTHVDNESHPKEQELHSERTEGNEGDEGRQSMSCDEGNDQSLKVASTEECGSIEDTAAVPRPGNSSIDNEIEKSGEREDEDVVVAEKTYAKKRSLMEQKSKSSTWGDSETDASDTEDTQELATALQEVRIYENQLASKLKKRRLERKQTLEEEVEGEAPPLTTGRSARKALLDSMTSDEDE